MADLSQLSTEQLMALKRERLSRMSDEELLALRNQRQPQAPKPEAPKQEQGFDLERAANNYFGGADGKMPGLKALGIGAADALTLNRTDELAAPAISAVQNVMKGNWGGALDEANRAVSLVAGIFNPMAGNYARYVPADEGEQQARANIQGVQQRAAKERPVSYYGSQVAASVALPAAAPAKGVGALARTGIGALEGGAYGAAAAEGAAPDEQKGDLGRLAGGAGAGAVGGVVGANIAPVVGRVANALQIGMPKGGRSQTNSLFGAMDNSTPPPPKGPTSRQAISKRVVKLADRGGGIEGIQERVGPYRKGDVDPTTAQALGEAGIRSLRVNARSPGKTPEAASKAVRANREGIPERIDTAIAKAFPATSRRSARAAISKQFVDASDVYEETLRKVALSPDADAKMSGFISRLPDDVRNNGAAEIADLARLDDLDPASLTSAQQLHYYKVLVGNRINFLKRNGDNTGLLPRLQRWQKKYVAAMDSEIPGYKEVRSTWGELSDKLEATDYSKEFFKRGNSEELLDEWEGFTDYQKDHALYGIATDLRERMDEATKLGENKTNIAAAVLTRNMIKKLRMVLGDEKVSDLKLALDLADQDFVKLGRIIGGSDTFPDAAEFVDQAMDIAPDMVRGKLSTMADQALGGAVRFVTNPLMEGRRNRMGAEMLQPFTQERQTALEEALRQYYANRSAATRAAMRGGNAGGVAGGSAAGQQ